ncbi:MAG: hypothetical protein OQJ87_05265 [Rhodospirillales bacterium]|nr:hypothetical protein [Rhodospirillales bacterium]MCW9002109.1 hypothetical protein [Rhodospirillales bacterium]
MQKQAFEIPCGQAVVLDREGEQIVCLKTERVGKEYVHHYLVPLHPAAEPGVLSLVYIDPEDTLTDLGFTVVFETGAPDGSDNPVPGHAFRTEKGTFLKIHEDPLAQKTFTYLDMETGALCRRQERGLSAVYTSWRACAMSDDGAIALSVVCEKFGIS